LKVGISALSLVSFLLLNGIVFALANFFILVPAFFYFYENYSVLLFVFLFFFVVALQISYYLFRDIPSIAVPLVFVPFSPAIGSLFFYLYWRGFLKKDFD